MNRIILSILFLWLGFHIGMNAQSRLYPTIYSPPDGIISQYDGRVFHLLLDKGEYSRLAFLIQPSFSGEAGCYYDDKDSTLVLRVAEKNIWYFDMNAKGGKKKKKAAEVGIKEYRCPISLESIKSLDRLFLAATFSSSYLAKPWGTDGTTYQLFSRGHYTAECWSPDKDSNCGQLVEILKSLTEAVKSSDPHSIDNLIPSMEELTRSFEDLLPEDLKEDNYYLIRGDSWF